MSRLQGYFVSRSEKDSVGARVALLRGKRGVADFAEELGINRKTVTRWEGDETLPDGASLLALKEKFGADPGWVLTGQGEAPDMASLTPDEQVLLDGYRALDAATRRRMLAFMLTESGPVAVQKKIKETVSVADKYRGANIGSVTEGDFTGTAEIKVGDQGNK